MVKYSIEYHFNSSTKVLFTRLSTASGLSEWFADDVNVKGANYTFFWDGTGQEAKLISKKDQKFVRFKWIDDEDDESYFEFKIVVEELTGDVALIVTDFAEEEDVQDSKDLWDSQITVLKQILGT